LEQTNWSNKNMNYYEASLKMHEDNKGKMETVGKVSVKNRDDLSTAYTPGVAEPCRRIKDNPEDVYRYTNKGNTVAVVSDGSAVLGLGNIGPAAAIPVMDGKALLFKEFAGVDAVPICLDTQDPDEIVRIVQTLAPTFGGINLEDISAPRCFEIEEKLQALLDIPVFHDDQHGTAVVVAAALINCSKVTGIAIDQLNVLINGAGAAGTAIAKMLLSIGVKDILVCDKHGILYKDDESLNPAMKKLAAQTNLAGRTGMLADGIRGRKVFIGVSGPKMLTEELIKTMAKDPIVFAMANPEPEIMPELAKAAGAAIVATGRSDFPNQINNVLVFPGLFKGALSVRARKITEDMKVAAAFALAAVIPDGERNAENIIPGAFTPGVADAVAVAVAKAWTDRTEA
jgi:malate dehydrogenase (oxaloacetate-decarboxylating)